TKPFTPDELFNAIKARFEKKELTARQTQKKLEELKINLATSIPHELRTPLNGIIASSQYLMEYFELSDIDEIKQIHENIYKSARRLHNLILNYLLYAELEILYADKEKLKEFRRTQFASPLNVFTHIFKKAAIENERTYDLDLNIRSEAVPIQEDHLNKIAKELSANAFKFSDTGKVNVSTGIEDREFRISVTDHGRGMNQVQINKIGAYIQFDRKIYEQQGSGLGLAIVRRLADIYGGSFEIVSRPGEFTTINLGFPLK
ncbi:MAG: sensor histidine kinase, partial [Bacteroidota bacterium]